MTCNIALSKVQYAFKINMKESYTFNRAKYVNII